MNSTKIVKADLDSPRKELSNGGLKSVVALLVRRQINSSSACIGRPIQLYDSGAPRMKGGFAAIFGGDGIHGHHRLRRHEHSLLSRPRRAKLLLLLLLLLLLT